MGAEVLEIIVGFITHEVTAILFVILGLNIALSRDVIAVKKKTFIVELVDVETDRKYKWLKHTPETPQYQYHTKYVRKGWRYGR